MDIQAIKAELWDLQGHTCDGRFTLTSDGSRDPDDHSCHGCTRVMELAAMLHEAIANGER